MKALKFLKKFSMHNIPLSVGMWVTEDCDLDCVHCMRNRFPTNELDTKEWKDIILQLKRENTLSLTFSGGEAFKRDDFFELASFVREQGFSLSVNSNGTLLDRNKVKKLKKLHLNYIQIALYGLDAKIHDSITRVSGSLAKSLNTIRLLQEYGINFRVRSEVMRDNFSQLELLIKEARKQNWDLITSCIVFPTLDGKGYPLEYMITDDQLKYAARKKLFSHDYHLDGFKPKGVREYYLSSIGRGSLATFPKGQVYPAVTMQIELGNLRKDSLRTIWRESSALKKIRKLKITDYKCYSCKYFGRCGWDAGLSLCESGNITARCEQWCKIMEYLYR